MNFQSSEISAEYFLKNVKKMAFKQNLQKTNLKELSISIQKIQEDLIEYFKEINQKDYEEVDDIDEVVQME